MGLNQYKKSGLDDDKSALQVDPMQKTGPPIDFAGKVNVNVSSERGAKKANVNSDLATKMDDERSDLNAMGKESDLDDDLGNTLVNQDRNSNIPKVADKDEEKQPDTMANNKAADVQL